MPQEAKGGLGAIANNPWLERRPESASRPYDTSGNCQRIGLAFKATRKRPSRPDAQAKPAVVPAAIPAYRVGGTILA